MASCLPCYNTEKWHQDRVRAVKPVNTILIDLGDMSLEMQAEEAPSFLKHSLMDHSSRRSEDQNAARKMNTRTG